MTSESSLELTLISYLPARHASSGQNQWEPLRSEGGAYLCFSRLGCFAILFIYPKQPPTEKMAVFVSKCVVLLLIFLVTIFGGVGDISVNQPG